MPRPAPPDAAGPVTGGAPTAPAGDASAAVDPRSRRGRSIVGPLILIGLGLLFLAQNFGLLPPDSWRELWRLWPLLLVLTGVELIRGRGGWVGGLVVALAILAVGAALSWVYFSGQSWDWSAGELVQLGPGGTTSVSEELGTAQRVELEITHGAGRLVVRALPGDSPRLIQAESTGDGAIQRDLNRRGERVELELRPRGRNSLPFGGSFRQDWTIGLTPRVPLELELNTGASDAQLDLSGLRLTRLALHAGASSLRVTLPAAAGRTEGVIQAGAANIDLTVPPGVAAHIRRRGALSNATIDQSRFPRVGDGYRSPDFDTAAHRVDIRVESGASNLTVR